MTTKMSAKEYYQAGLVPEGIYRFEIVEANVKTYDISEEKQKPGGPTTFSKIELVVDLLSNHDDSYEISGRPVRVYDQIPLSGKPLRRLNSLHKAVTGRNPTLVIEDGEEVIDFEQICINIKGGYAWGSVEHKKRQAKNADGTYEDTEELDPKLGWNFGSDPDTLRAPKWLKEKLGLA